MRKFLLISTLFFCFPVYGQNFIVGKVLDDFKNPIAYASIGYYNKQIGAISDSLGNFTVSKIIGDSIKISAIGFKSRVLKINDNTEEIKVVLVPDSHILDDVTVVTKAKSRKKIYLGHYSSKSNYLHYLGQEFQSATFIPNNQKISGFITEVKFVLQNYQNTNYILRIRLLTINKEDSTPLNDLLLNNNIIQSHDLKHITKIQLKDKIPLPKEGVFVSFEWLSSSLNRSNAKTPHIIGSFGGDRNYMFHNFKDIRWYPANIYSPLLDGFAVPNVSIKVVGY